jgi:hypothetical protein
VPKPSLSGNSRPSIGSNGSTSQARRPKIEAANEADGPVKPGANDALPSGRIEQPAAKPRAFNDGDDRRFCGQCLNLTAGGLCLAARRGELRTTRIYHPILELAHRCEGYAPKAIDPDNRPGRERWPGLTDKEESHETH